MNNSTSNDKTFAQTTQTKTPDCIRKASLPFADLTCGKLVHVSFDCPENLRNSFNQETRANGTSTCHCLRGYMMAYVVASQSEKACLTNTIKSPVVIKKLVMPTYVKLRHRRLKPVDVSPELASVVEHCGVCGKDAYARAIDVEGSRVLCRSDFEKAKRHLLGWKVLA